MGDEFLIQTSTWDGQDGTTQDPARICASLAVSLTMFGASTDERNHAVAALWARLRLGPPTHVTCRLTYADDHRLGVLAVNDEILAEVRLPTDLQSLRTPPVISTLLDIVTDQDLALIRHRQELESTDQGLLALHGELADQAEQLTRSSERQLELLETEQTARAAAEAARAAAESARSRLAFLSHVGAVLGASLDHRQVLSRLSTLLVPRFASGAEVWLVAESGELELYGAPGPLPGEPAEPATPPMVRRVRDTRRTEQLTPGPDTGEHGMLVVPLVSLGTVLGVLTVTPPSRPFAHDDVVIVSETAGRAAAALSNALRFEQEREVAEQLQHAMLTELPTGPGADCAARYLPAVIGLNVGGDWYDAYHRPDGTLVLAVGDVAGHGLAAATLMGQLRTAMRAYAMDLADPGKVLTKLHALIRHLDPDHCATAVLAMVAPNGDMSLATAGHPPPLLRDTGGTVRRLEYQGPMLGLPIDHTFVAATVPLRPGATLIFYTDGLIERRDAIIDEGIDQLAAAFAVAPGPPERIADTVCEIMLAGSSREDDTCLLICQLTPERARESVEPPPEPERLP
ncbi:MAG TPA: GAF domain-containing SpoIIE family protein phosphatase [Streptosporangiaceae bacterium]|nr:GAF domain-containing SpoIIE family protein phosphatase [Streptosporangiaceae bacterium]